MNDIQNLKQQYGQSAESIIANGLGLIKKNSNYRCPNGLAHKNQDRTPSMGWDSNLLQFHCFTCGLNIDIYGYYRQHLNYTHNEIINELLDNKETNRNKLEDKRNIFNKELLKVKEITKECIEYIKLRGITEDTIKHFRLKSYNTLIAFPYYRFETVVGYKTRKPKKNIDKPKMLSVEGSKPYLFMADDFEIKEELIICEGEFDCMVIYQCGYKNVVSVGAGANSLSKLLEQARNFIDKFEHLVIVSDNDDAGENMDKFFLNEFKDKVKLIDKSLYCRNDINEELVLKGKESVIKIVESGRFKIEGRRDLDTKPYQGITERKGKYIPTGIPTIDESLNDLAPSCVTLLTGRSNGGKTTFCKQIIANAINLNDKVYVVSGEGDQETFINSLYQCVIGRDKQYYNIVKINKKLHKEPTQDVLKALQEWHKGKLTIFNKGDSKLKNTDQLFKMIEYEIKVKKHDLVVIDNLMSVLSAKSTEKNEAQADFMQRCCDLAKCYKVHIILVLHPNKEYRKGNDMDFEQISGTSDLPNKADNIITVIREYEEENLIQGISGKISVLKNRYYSDLVSCEVHYEKETGLLVERQDDKYIAYKFDWEKYLPEDKKSLSQSWLQQAIELQGDTDYG